MNKLAICGGTPVRTKLFPAYNTIGEEEKRAVLTVLESGNLSQFLGAWHKDFYGGPYVQAFEKEWSTLFKVKHTISVNSNTSGLFAAIGACGIQPGDEVIVSPYTMSAGAIAPLIYGAVPVFADIDIDNFGLDPASIERCITPRTKAILVVHIFGNPSKMNEVMQIARKHNLTVIEDCAQAPMAMYKDKLVGTIGHIGVFSLNYHKHVHTGEGGVVVTNDDLLAEKLFLIRNHGEQVVEAKGTLDLLNTQGFNYRMTEIAAAIGIEQLKKLPGLLVERRKNIDYLTNGFEQIQGLTAPLVEQGNTHAYYVHPLKYDQSLFSGVHRNRYVDALKAELPSAVMREDTPLIGAGYVKPLYLQPIYQQRISACSFNCPRYTGQVSYAPGICPNAEQLHYNELITHEFMRPGMSTLDLMDVINAFQKVAENIKELIQ